MSAQAVLPRTREPASDVAAVGALVELKGVSVTIEGQRILERVDLAVHPGELVTVIGPNGAGKTTLVKVALGLLPATSGGVVTRRGLRMAYSPQALAIDRTMPIDVQGFLALVGRRPAAALSAALTEVGLEGIGRRPMRALSGGELRRVLLARALLRDPELLVLDEPLAGVDVTGQLELYELIGAVRRRRGCAVLLVSHDLHLVMAATDRVICLDHHVCCSGPPEAVAQDAAFLRLFGEQLARVVALYRHHHMCRHDTPPSPEARP